MNPYHHALSSVSRYGGCVEDYLPLHQWFDESKAFFPDFRHRALRHHAEGIFLCERLFGPTLTNTDGRVIPTRFIGEQHVKEDLGRILTVQDWLSCLKPAAVTAIRGRSVAYWKAVSWPYPEPGIRLIPQQSITEFDQQVVKLCSELDTAVTELDQHYDELRRAARRWLGRASEATE